MKNINIFVMYCAPNCNINAGTPNFPCKSFFKDHLTASNLIYLNY